MPSPTALGFYAKHPLVMDQLYDLWVEGDCIGFSLDSESGLGLPDGFNLLISQNSERLLALCEQLDREFAPLEDLYRELRGRLAKAGAKVGRETDFRWNRRISAKSTRFKPARYFEI